MIQALHLPNLPRSTHEDAPPRRTPDKRRRRTAGAELGLDRASGHVWTLFSDWCARRSLNWQLLLSQRRVTRRRNRHRDEIGAQRTSGSGRPSTRQRILYRPPGHSAFESVG